MSGAKQADAPMQTQLFDAYDEEPFPPDARNWFTVGVLGLPPRIARKSLNRNRR